ncbi:MAG: hypothetical protein U9R15_01675 [Chloroflexota bacterium]|nr:hypothetical protein [Chloroflexota bacterium]
MIQLPDVSLPAQAYQRLETLQATIDQIVDYADQVAEARRRFRQQNRRDNSTFREIRAVLTEMCPGARRCAYCEDSCADEVEHIEPKDLYPEKVFVWKNYLYACGPCNGPKNNLWAVFSDATGRLTEVQRRRGDPIVPPEPGAPVFINPRRENPLEAIELDLIDTFYFLPSGDEGSTDYQRADYTIKILRLNERDLLPAAREEAYRSYRARLREYIARRDEGASPQELDNLVRALQRMGHPTVWKEMKRQQDQMPQLGQLFAQSPESLNW